MHAQVPPWLPLNADLVIVASGVVEILLGAGLLALTRWRVPVGWIVAVFFVLIFPGNISQFVTHTDALASIPTCPAASGYCSSRSRGVGICGAQGHGRPCETGRRHLGIDGAINALLTVSRGLPDCGTVRGNVTTVNLSVCTPVGLAACAASTVVTLSACSSDKPASSPSTSTGAASAPAMTAAEAPPATRHRLPTQAPGDGGTPGVDGDGATGNVAVTGSTDKAAPLITVTQPFSVTETEVHTLHAGDGPVVAPTPR